jgi:hypothetical protein
MIVRQVAWRPHTLVSNLCFRCDSGVIILLLVESYVTESCRMQISGGHQEASYHQIFAFYVGVNLEWLSLVK